MATIIVRGDSILIRGFLRSMRGPVSYNQCRLHSSIGNVQAAEYDAVYYAEHDGSAVA